MGNQLMLPMLLTAGLSVVANKYAGIGKAVNQSEGEPSDRKLIKMMGGDTYNRGMRDKGFNLWNKPQQTYRIALGALHE